MEFKVGQVLNSKGRGIYGRLIRFRNSLIYGKEHNWSHSAIIVDVDSERVLVYEALSDGFVAKYYSEEFLEKGIEEGYYVIGEVKAELKDVKKNGDKYLGRGYGFFDIFGIVLFWLFGVESKFFSTGAQRLICSEAVARILYDASGKKIDFEKEFGVPYDLIEPMFLWESKQIRWLIGPEE